MLGFWQHYLNPFLNSTFFLALTTALVAGVAYFLYRRQKTDQQQNAAYIIYLEIEKAEELLGDAEKTLAQYQVKKGSGTAVGDDAKFPAKLQVMRTDNWAQYRHLLSRAMPASMLRKIDEFYTNCRLFDETLAYIDAGFSRNEAEVRKNMFSMIAKYMDEVMQEVEPNPKNDKAIAKSNQAIIELNKERIEAFKSNFPTSYTYGPIKPYQDAEYYASLLIGKSLVNSPVGERLKELANVKERDT